MAGGGIVVELPVLSRSSACTSTPAIVSFILRIGKLTRALCLTFLEKNSLEQRVLISQHQTLIGGRSVALLQRLQRVLVPLDRGLELLDILGPPFAKGRLSLSVPLLALFRRRIDLNGYCQNCPFKVIMQNIPVSSLPFSSASGRHPGPAAAPPVQASRPTSSSSRGHPGRARFWGRPRP